MFDIGTMRVKSGLADMLKGGVIMDVTNAEQAQIAGSIGFKAACENAQPALLEPIMNVEITVPDENVGDIIGDLNSRRGRVLGTTPRGHNNVVGAEVPLAEMLTYAPDLTSMTGGRGDYHMELLRYDEVPAVSYTHLTLPTNREV